MRLNIAYHFLSSILSIALVLIATGKTPVRAAAAFDPSKVAFREVVTGLTQPIFITNAGDDSGRLFIVERAGRIRIFKNGRLLLMPFLDIQSVVNAAGSEQGLLALAFHPDYATNRQFYTVYTDQNGSLVLSRFLRSSGQPDRANPGSRATLLTIPHPTHQNHNGGTLAFGPDGYLYWSTGDGGGAGDPFNNAQNLNSLLGKILRLDVDHTDPGLSYSIPSGNPFYGMPNRRAEIWAYGLRNPWRFSFDRQTGDLFTGDVGQGNREEIDFQPAESAGGENYGWRIMEGTLCFNPATGCNQSGKVLPIAEYSHSVGCSITGGYIYRGAFYPDMRGQYFYGDFCSGILFSLYDDPVNGWTVMQVADTPYAITTFGEDEQGELYVNDYRAGTVYQICYGTVADFNIEVAGTLRGRFPLCQHQAMQKSFSSVDSGPVEIRNINNLPGIAAERVIYNVQGVNTSFSEMMGVPASQLDTTYWLPWYNNKDLNTQLRFGNVSNTDATVRVFIGGVEMNGSPFSLTPGASTRKSFAGIDRGPVKIESNVNIVAAERVIFNVNGVNTSFSEITALSNSLLDTTYWLPWYNNKDLDTQLRFANVSGATATVHISIGGIEMNGSPFVLVPGASLRRRFAGVNSGPVKIESDQAIIAAERVIYKVKGIATSFSEVMALPNSQLDSTFWLPWYTTVGLDSQLRFANVSSTPATVHIYVGGKEMNGSPFSLAPGASTRRKFAGVNHGPLQIVSDVNLIAAERVIYRINNTPRSFSEMMALPDNQLDSTYWLPWYNNKDLNTQLRFGFP